MLVAGLTGGVGSGKSTVGNALAHRGAVVVDADQLAREAVLPGTLAYEAIVARFSRRILNSDKTIDRAALAAVVFGDDDALADLNDIVHPFVRERAAALVAEQAATDNIVILMVPLLIESGRYDSDVIIVVDCEEAVAIDRAVAQRGWTAKEVKRRMTAQASRDERKAQADLVIDNSGGLEVLEAQVDRAWVWLQDCARSAV